MEDIVIWNNIAMAQAMSHANQPSPAPQISVHNVMDMVGQECAKVLVTLVLQ